MRSEICAVDLAFGARLAYGPADRIAVLVEFGRYLVWADAGSPLWPGSGLLPPVNSVDAS
ncbi:hypothetical protein ACIPSA_50950 [Streptomyces sp. NPDC086549]|uniref:hypothetical protein n=1 Tax=Streptomyces sp. NPDC086549 TaxID=3365752 RepID=UPI0038285DAD